MQFPKRQFLSALPIILIVLLGAAVRFHGLGDDSFWLDEVFSARVIDAPMSQIMSRVPPDKPPLDYFIQALAHRLPGLPEYTHRLPAAIEGTILLVGLYIWALACFGRRIALLTLIIAAAHTQLIRYSQEARPYSLFAALFVWQQLAFLFWWRKVSEEKIRKGAALAAALIVILTIGLYLTLYAAAIVLGGQVLFLAGEMVFSQTRQSRPTLRTRLRPMVQYLAMIAAAFLFAFPVIYYSRQQPSTQQFWQFDGWFSASTYQGIADHFLAGLNGWGIWVAAGLGCAIMAVGIANALRRNSLVAFYLLSSSLLLLPATIAMFPFMNRFYWSRYTIFCVPGICIFAALAMESIGLWLARRRPSLAAALPYALTGFFAVSSIGFYLFIFPHRDDWRGLAHFIAAQTPKGEPICVPSELDLVPLKYYLEREGRHDFQAFSQADQPNLPTGTSQWNVSSNYGPNHRKFLKAEVAEETRRCIEWLGRDGGYICGPDHHIKPDISVENTLSLFNTIQNFRKDGYTSISS